ncbi:MAG: hypothetical protein ACYSU0_17940 [Planctomycetota bacterium]|jgi:hypothetical protein
MRVIETFDAERIAGLRERSREVSTPRPDGPDGWSRSAIDPAELFGLFKPIRLREGMILRAYQYRSCGNGNGLVFAMPVETPFPAPRECASGDLEDYSPEPVPPGATWDIMRLVEGDGTPWSYILASVLERELEEFGAIWHGCSWSTHTILGAEPLSREGGRRSQIEPMAPADQWEWREPEPEDWRPAVGDEAGATVARFYTYSGVGRQSIFRHVDTFESEGYSFYTEREAIAEGPGGFVF